MSGNGKYIYRVYLESGVTYMTMTPNQAAYYADRHDVRVEPVEAKTPIAPLGQLERGYSTSAWRPAR